VHLKPFSQRLNALNSSLKGFQIRGYFGGQELVATFEIDMYFEPLKLGTGSLA
jgi:hypothetical protein